MLLLYFTSTNRYYYSVKLDFVRDPIIKYIFVKFLFYSKNARARIPSKYKHLKLFLKRLSLRIIINITLLRKYYLPILYLCCMQYNNIIYYFVFAFISFIRDFFDFFFFFIKIPDLNIVLV